MLNICRFNSGQPCIRALDWDGVLLHRECCQAMERDERDFVVKASLIPHRQNGKLTSANKKTPHERIRPSQKYYFGNQQICAKTFAFLHGLHEETVQVIGRHYDEFGLLPRVHGNKGRQPHNALSAKHLTDIVTWIKHFSEHNGFPLPGRTSNHRDSNASLLLPTSMTLKNVHNDLTAAAREANTREISYETFRSIWKKYCPDIQFMRPATDLCHYCQKYILRVRDAINLPDEVKKQRAQEWQDHLVVADSEREQYKELIVESKDAFKTLTEEQKQRPRKANSVKIMQHISADYAQKVCNIFSATVLMHGVRLSVCPSVIDWTKIQTRH